MLTGLYNSHSNVDRLDIGHSNVDHASVLDIRMSTGFEN